MDDEARWDTARRLLHDATIRPEDRLAGLLLLLYAQWPAAISRLTVDHIEETDGAVRIRLGAVPVELPTPVADLARQQVAARRSHAVLAQTDSPWLFPGGQPGRPISAWAMGERLRKLGIRLAEARSTALFQLATELPAAVLARTLGIDITVAVKWQRAAAGDWGAYAAEISCRSAPLTNWQREIIAMLEQTLACFEIAYGYPPGANDVLVADDQSRAMAARLGDAAVPAALVTFYTSIAELQLPDIDHGYFIHSSDLVLDHLTEYGPVRLTNHHTGIVFGNDGGGILFALDQGGQVHRSTTASWFDDFEPTAPTLTRFLEQLHRATAVFTNDTMRHAATEHS